MLVIHVDGSRYEGAHLVALFAFVASLASSHVLIPRTCEISPAEVILRKRAVRIKKFG